MNVIEMVITAGSLTVALGVIIGRLFQVKKFVDQHDESIEELKNVKKEQKLMFSALFACLDGLEQLGANHSVPKAKFELEQWLNDKAHD